MIKTMRAALAGAISVAALSLFSAASAATVGITVESFSLTGFNAYKAGLASSVTETFEQNPGVKARELSGGFSSALVGDFTTLGGDGSGASVIGDGQDLGLRNKPNYGRMNTTAGGKWFLDSNDTLGVGWDVSTGGLFNAVAFTLSDAADTGATLSVFADGVLLESFLKQKNGVADFIVIAFSQMVSGASIRLSNSKLNDGFAIDDATVGVAAVPLPPAAALLVGGLAAMGWFGRRRRAAA